MGLFPADMASFCHLPAVLVLVVLAMSLAVAAAEHVGVRPSEEWTEDVPDRGTFDSTTNLGRPGMSVGYVAGYVYDQTGPKTCPEGMFTIPDGYTSIGEGAFYSCTGLTSVKIPTSVTSIGYSAFRTTGLTSVKIPNSVTSISDYAFEGCTGLTSVSIPTSVKSIGDYAFLGCTGLTSVTIPTSVKSIGHNAFDSFGHNDRLNSTYRLYH